MRPLLQFSCDFETTTDVNDCRVWSWGMYDIDKLEVYKLGKDINSFMYELKELSKDYRLSIYFHNLGFDGEFILSWLLNNDYVWTDEKKLSKPKKFKTLITDNGQFYQMKVKMLQRGSTITFKDSLKVIPLRVAVISKAYGIEQLKGEIDYHKYRPVGYEMTYEERAYLINDIEIVGKALHQTFESGLTKLTMASNAMNEFKENEWLFEYIFPRLDDKIDYDIRKAYRGGYTYVNKKYQEQVVYNGQTFDVNSLYPHCMYEYLLPCEEPLTFEGEYIQDDKYPLYIQHMEFNFEVKPGMTPIIQARNKFGRNNAEYLEECIIDTLDMWVTNIDLELIKRHYEIWNITFKGGYKFKGKKGMFREYIDKWSEIKKKSTGGRRTIAKLMLNSLYGKFAQRRGTTDKITGETWSLQKKPNLVDGVVKYEVIQTPERESLYTPVAVFITAYARKVLIDAIDSVGDRFCYCDTDSIHILGNEDPDIDIHDKKLGAWKRESYWKCAKFIRAKTYIEEEIHDNGNELLVKVAGMPDNLKKEITFDNFDRGYIGYGKLIPKRVPGGVVLVETDFTIK